MSEKRQESFSSILHKLLRLSLREITKTKRKKMGRKEERINEKEAERKQKFSFNECIQTLTGKPSKKLL